MCPPKVRFEMVDKIELSIDNESFNIAPKNSLIVQPGQLQQNESGVYEPICEPIMINNQRCYSASAGVNGRYYAKINSYGLNVSFSPSQLLSGENVSDIGHAGVCESLDTIQDELNKVGIAAEVDTANLSRLDLFANIITKESLVNYAPIFDSIYIPRMKKRAYGEKGFIWYNTKEEVELYSKYRQLVDMKKDIPVGLHPNTQRIELRIKGTAKVRSVLPVSTGLHLKDPIRYKKLPIHFADKIESTILKVLPADLPPPMNLKGLMRMSTSGPAMRDNLLVGLLNEKGITEDQYRADITADANYKHPGDTDQDKENRKKAIYRHMLAYKKARERIRFIDPVDQQRYSDIHEGYMAWKKAV